MLDFTLIHDKKFAVIFIEDDGTEHGKWTVLTGVAKWCDGHLSVHRGMDVPEFPIPDDTLNCVTPVLLPEVREYLVGADFFTVLGVVAIPEDIPPSERFLAGLRLPRDAKDHVT